MSYIKNIDQLLSHGNYELRKKALEIVEYALSKADPYLATKRLIKRDGQILYVADKVVDLKKINKVYVIGAGKATFPIALALEEILEDYIDEGVVICKYGQEGCLKYCRLYYANHPIPDENGFRAAKEIMSLAKVIKENDLVFACFTGGSSALMPYPAEGITLKDKQIVNKLLLSCGANINEINSVRKHISQLKGGRLAKIIHPKAYLINLTVSDVIGDPLDYITCPTVPDTSTFEDARAAISKYRLWNKIPESVSDYLKKGSKLNESPKEIDLKDHNITNFIIVPGDAACVAAEEKAKELKLNTIILSTMFEGESAELGRTFVSIGKEILIKKRPLQPPCAIIAGGETTIKLGDDFGLGGPNQEFVLSSLLYMKEINNLLVLGLDTDGTDGPTDVAGAIGDYYSIKKIEGMGFSILQELSKHSETELFKKINDAIITGSTGTNVNDLKILIVL
ncbi:MAG: glycerate kinase [Candidatus Caldatribacteriota bacterium]